MKVFINNTTDVKFDVEDDKAGWFEQEADFTEFFEEPKPVIIKPKVKQIKPKKAKVEKKVIK